MIGPEDHHVDALELESQTEVDLFTILLRDQTTVFYFRNGPKVTWQGKTYENVPIVVGGEDENAEDRNARPTLRIFNSKKVFGPLAQQGLFELATVTRHRVLSGNLAADLNISVRRVWLLTRVTGIAANLFNAELRSPLDGPNMQVPHRSYQPPEFPFVAI